ncbi:hypothetical protein H2201_002715 [Coniosporium apollinis]|uniref:Heterokaryon incompatibility domain-containing protein n=1 Tax=Coniosporium apollinis TaxID=61459 RepID=A0ABQ9NXT8_9PEZI|nr:hypothetical protein H2201_002715 [Coniosporium apollinis]
MATADDDLEPSVFLRRIRQLGEQRDQEDAARLAQLENDILQGRSERLARRAERAKSLASPSSTPKSLSSAAATPTKSEDTGPAMSQSSEPVSDKQPHKDDPGAAMTTPAEPTRPASPGAGTVPTRSGTLSWQRRPTSSSGRRPLSVVAAENNAARSPRPTPDTTATSDDENVSRDKIAQSLGARDPSWFRQTADRGIGSAAYRRSQGETASDTGSTSSKRQLPGMSREPVPKSEDVASPPPDSARSASPSRASAVRGSANWDNRSSADTSMSDHSRIEGRSPLPTLESQKFSPPGSDQASTDGGDRAGVGRTLAMSPSQGRISPERIERPASPTKGAGGFVQSAILKRSDSVNKRWSAQPPGLSRQSSTTSNRSFGGLTGSMSMPKLGSAPIGLTRGNSWEPTSRPSSSHSNLSALATSQTAEGKNDQLDKEGFVKPARPHHMRGHSVTAAYTSTPGEASGSFDTSPPSPSKRFSPTKSSWLENALNRPDSPKPTKPPPQQPAWMAEISKLKQQRNSVDMSRVGGMKDSSSSTNQQSDTATPTRSLSSVRRTDREKEHSISNGTSQKEGKVQSPPTKSKPIVLVAKHLERKTSDPAPKGDSELSEATAEATAEARAPSPAPTQKPEPSQEPEPLSITPRTTKPILQAQPLKSKPETPPKRDFRATLKPRQGPAESQKKEELEFQNVFGKLKRAQTEKYVAPDELKGNILRGKSGLAQSIGPQKSERRDELKDSLIKQKELMKTKAADAGPVEAKKTNGDVPAPNPPEALAKLKNLDRTDSMPKTPPPTQDKTPEAIPRSMSLKGTSKPAPPVQQSQVSEQPHVKAAASSSTLAARFNTTLAGVLARGPSPLASAGTSGRTPLESGGTIAGKYSSPIGEDGTVSKELTHMTKGRAKGPRRRAPATKADNADPPAALSVKAVPLVRAKDILASSTPALPKQSTDSRPEPATMVVSTPARDIAKPKPITPQKSPLLAEKIKPPQEHVEEPPPVQAVTLTVTPPKAPELIQADLGPTKPDPLFSSRPMPPKSTVPSEWPLIPKIRKPSESDSIPAVERPASPAPSPEKSKVSVRNAATLWGLQSASPSPPSIRIKSPVKLPTRQDEQVQGESGDVPHKPEVKSEPVGLGLGGFFAPATSQLEQNPVRNEPKPPINYPLSPPLSAGIPPKPGKKPVSIASREPSASLKSPPQVTSPIPHTSEAGQLFADFFDDRPVTTGGLDVDAQAILTSSAGQADKIKTLRKHIQEVVGDGKMTPVPAQEEHILFDNTMYLCTHVFGSSSGIKTTEVYLWAGSAVAESTLEDAQLFCRRVAKENNGKLIIIRQGKEPSSFFQALGGIVITRHGSRSDRPQKYMLCGRRHMGHIAFDEVELLLPNFCSGFPYIISSQTSKHYLWKGFGCGAEELGCARLICMDLGGTSEVEEIDEGHEPAAFFDLFPALDNGSKSIPRSAEHWRLKAKSEKYNTRLFRIEQHQQQSGFQVSNFFASIVRRPSWQSILSPTNDRPQTPRTPSTPGAPQSKVVEIAPFCQSDLEAEHIYVLDAFFEIYIIVGALSRSQSHAFSTALLFAQEYGILAASLEDRPFVPVSTVVMEGVPRDMKAVFRRWEDRLMPTSALMAGEIRVLDIKQPSNPAAPIELAMRHIILKDLPGMTVAAQRTEYLTTLLSGPNYFALSYTWGKENNCRPIKIDDAKFYVTPTLECVLRQIQARKVPTLWVDAICINQSDDAEKTVQVRLMGRIYHCAYSVIIWLGEEKPPTTGLAIDFLNQHITLDYVNISHSHDLGRTRNNPEYTAAWDAVGQDLMKREWWRRMWVIQETALARRLIIYCGQHTLVWDRLQIATEFARAYDLPIFHRTAAERAGSGAFMDNSNWKSIYRRKMVTGAPMPISEILMNNISCFSKDPRDMIFSLLGLATDVDGAPELDPDYEKSVKQVYTDFVKFQVRKHGFLDIICASKHPKTQPDLPSWVPDWSNLRDNVSVLFSSFEHDPFAGDQYVYCASRGLLETVRFSEDDRILSVVGIQVDTIATMGEPSYGMEEFFSDVDAWFRLALGANLEKSEHDYVGGGNTLDAFNRTLTADKTRSGHRAQEGQRGFEAVMVEENELPESYRQVQDLTLEERQRFWMMDALQAMMFRVARRRLLITKKGYLGLGPPDTELGDSVFIIAGCTVPIILRKKDEQWRFVGESFVTGIMDGEIVQKAIQDLSGNFEVDRLEQGVVLPKDSEYRVEEVQLW